MYVRLAFAVAAHLDADVLLVDEVLAVGDAAFQERCLARMGDLSGTGRTVVFVSHNLAAVSRLCSRALLLDRGSLLGDGSVAEGLAAYGLLNHKQSESIRAATIGPLQDKVQFLGLTVNGSADLVNTLIPPDQPIRIAIRGNLTVPLHGFRVTLCLFKGDQLVLGMHDAMAPEDMPQGDFESIFELPALFLSPGNYAIDVNMYSEERSEWLLAKGCCTFTVATAWHPLYEPTHGMGLVNLARSGRRHPLASEREAPRA
jgi:lipopolysaccharide transport system ATP-binding protein